MAQKTILHICVLDKFIPPFVDFVKTHFEFEMHIFVVMGDIKKYPITLRENVIYIENVKSLILIKALYRTDKIILHSLFHLGVVKLLAIQPWLLRKCYWVMWGGDLYHYQFRPRGLRSDIQEAIRAFVIKRIGFFVTYFKGEYELAEQWYGAKGKHHECFTYPSNIYKSLEVKLKGQGGINIQVGNSATETNQHLDVLEKLAVYKDQNIKIFVPLSYGDMNYASRVIEYGKSVFGDKFIPMLDFMPFEKYLSFLSEIDIAVFNHNRQQAIGNAITLLGLGKKVYMRTEVTTWNALQQLGLHVFDVEHLEVSRLPVEQAEENQKIISKYFSEANLVAQLGSIFGMADLASSR